jgi:hypothetical protein
MVKDSRSIGKHWRDMEVKVEDFEQYPGENDTENTSYEQISS